MYASIFNCSTAFLAWEILVVLLDTSSFILFFLEEMKLRPFKEQVANVTITERTVMWTLTNPCPPHQHWQAVGHKYKADTIYFCSLAPWHLIALQSCIVSRQHLNPANDTQMQSTWPWLQCENGCPGSCCQRRTAVHKQTLQALHGLAPRPSYT